MSVTRALHRGPLSPVSAQAEVGRAVGQPTASLTVCKADVSRDDLTGFVLGQYELGKKIGGGGMGSVFAARHVRLDRAVAIKFIAAEVAGLEEAGDRFDQEILALGKLQHPNIVQAIDAGCLNGLKYLVMERIDGVDLNELIERRGPLPVCEACDLIRQAAIGLAYSHQHGFLHRDIKPNNLILDTSGVVNILDFGLVRNASAQVSHTTSGEMIGTFDFVAPEQAHDASRVDARSDIYSLGCTLIFLLSGRPPFGSARYATAAAKLKGHLFDQPKWLTAHPADIPNELVAAIARMVAKSPLERMASAEDVIQVLRPWAKSGDASSDGSTTSTILPNRTVRWSRSVLMTLAKSTSVITVLLLLIVFVVRRPMASRLANTPESTSSPEAVAGTVIEQSTARRQPVEEDLLEEAAPPPFPVSVNPMMTEEPSATTSVIPFKYEPEFPDAIRPPRTFELSQ